MFFWRRVALQSPEDDLKPTATPGYSRNFRELNDLLSRGKSFSGRERNALFLNLKGEGFAEVGGLLGVDFTDDARAVATMDWDQDGDLDLWVTNRNAPQLRLLRNTHPTGSSSLLIRLIGNGTTTNRDAIGARLILAPTGDPQRKQIRTVHAGGGFLAQSSALTHFGLGEAPGDLQLSVAWPGGETETFSSLKSGNRYTITQGRKVPEVTPLSDPVQPSVSREEIPPPLKGTVPRGFWLTNRVPFPALDYTDKAGETRSITSLVGKPILVNLWATWCHSCVRELQDFGKLDEFLQSQEATVLALNVDGLAADGGALPEGTIAEILKRAGYDSPHGIATREGLAKIELMIEFLTSRQEPLAIPSSFLIDGEGNLAAIYGGAIEGKQVIADLNLLNRAPTEQLKRATPRDGRWFFDPRQINRTSFLGDYATSFAKGGFPGEARRLSQMIKPQDGALTAKDYYNRAKTAARQRLGVEAEQLYREALRLEPDFGQALTGLGALLLMQKRVEEAEDLFEKALLIDPNHATALINLAMIDQSRGQKERALARLQKVVTKNPDYAEAHLNLGSLLASMKQLDKAVSHLSKAIKLNPKRAIAHLNLASVYMEKQDWQRAEQRYRIARQLSPKMPHAHLGLATLLARQDLHPEAVISLRKAISLGGGNAKSYTQLARSLLALGERKGASEALLTALKIDPNDAEAKRVITEAGLLRK
ncbi:MAG: tetratricopeptide (TPR) repeat protein/thiol-disulfide isomerase/thioredoxin [Akkermansiaceae bacterium]|jgi:tetratricopeptide (TPR) repeat protein/thiol-disulfide isomerase/thioredoxin